MVRSGHAGWGNMGCGCANGCGGDAAEATVQRTAPLYSAVLHCAPPLGIELERGPMLPQVEQDTKRHKCHQCTVSAFALVSMRRVRIRPIATKYQSIRRSSSIIFFWTSSRANGSNT
jgi:hypothetical protein